MPKALSSPFNHTNSVEKEQLGFTKLMNVNYGRLALAHILFIGGRGQWTVGSGQWAVAPNMLQTCSTARNKEID